MNRSLKLSLLLALAIGSSQATALELGQIRVKSALGQPLLAEIPLTPADAADLQGLNAHLASPEEFAHAGITGGQPSVPLQFSIADSAGGKVIRITSSEAINDPYLDLLIQVDNASGKSVREYTILLDPPGGAGNPPVASAPSSRPSHAARPAAPSAPSHRAAGAPARAAAPAQAEAASATPGQYGPISRGQTLSEIARRTTPAGADVSQMLLALKQANPQAFYRDNINALKVGAVLRVPSSQEVQALDAAQANAEVRRQNEAWRNGASAPVTVADAATHASASSSPTGAAATQDRLALVPAKQGGSREGAGGGKGAGAAGQHQEQLRDQEALATLQQQGAELNSRLKDLEDINQKNERLLALKDSEIAELQRKLADARKAAKSPAVPVAASSAEAARPSAVPQAPATPASAPSPSAAMMAAKPASGASATPPPAASTTSAAAPTAAASHPAPASPAKPKPAPVAPPAAEEEPWYMQTWAMIAGAAVVVLLLLLALLKRRRPAAAAAPAAGAASSLADRFGVLPPDAPASADPDQDELLDQLAEHPDDIGLHLELVSLYYSRRDVDHFEAAAEAMHAHVTDPAQPEWQDVLEMGRDLAPGHPLFGGAVLPPEEEEVVAPDDGHFEDAHGQEEPLHAFDFDALDDHVAPSAPAEPQPARPKVSEYHFDFNLTPASPQTPPPAPATVFEDAHEPPGAGDGKAADEPLSTWHFEEPAEPAFKTGDDGFSHFSDDPVDTKLDLARAYLDMGDSDGARAMLEEVLGEGSQTQKDTARKLLETLG